MSRAIEAEQVTQLILGEPVQVEDGGERVGAAWSRPTSIPGGCEPHRRSRTGGRVALPAGGPEPLPAARAFLGAPYEWGGMTAAGIDCSGLVHMALRASGRLVPRDSWQQEAAGSPVMPGSEVPGDVVVYGVPERADHVAFWLGEGLILHATARGGLGVLEEAEPAELAARRRCVVRLIPG